MIALGILAWIWFILFLFGVSVLAFEGRTKKSKPQNLGRICPGCGRHEAEGHMPNCWIGQLQRGGL